jgi:hypothetical protein
MCSCALCNIEVRLLSDLSYAEAGAIGKLFSTSPSLGQYSAASNLLSHLKTSPADATSDELLRELFAIRTLNPQSIESLLVLTFVPMLHGAIRRVARQQPGLSHEDITQQALSFLLQFLPVALRFCHFTRCEAPPFRVGEPREWQDRAAESLRWRDFYYVGKRRILRTARIVTPLPAPLRDEGPANRRRIESPD